MNAPKLESAHVRLTAKDWEQISSALQYAAGDGLEASPALLTKFGKDFEPSLPLISQAADLIDLFVACRFAPGPVTVAIDGPQASGKTLLTAAITHALRTVKVPVHVYGSDPFDDQKPTYVLIDDVAETTARAGGIEEQKRRRQMIDDYYTSRTGDITRGFRDGGVVFTVKPVPLRVRLRFALRRALAAFRGLGR